MSIRHMVAAALAVGTQVLTGLPAAAQLAPPSIVEDGNGAFHVDFTTPGVFDMSSHFEDVSDGGIAREMHILHTRGGSLSGAGRDTDGKDYDVLHVVTGSCKATRGQTVVTQKIKSIGSVGSDDEKEFRAVSKFEGVVEGYGAGAKLVGFTRTRSCLRFDYGPFSKRKIVVCTNNLLDDQVFPLPSAGQWTIRILFDQDGKDLYGIATVFISDALPTKTQTVETTVSGKLDPDGEAVFKFQPLVDDGPISKLTLRARVVPRTGATPPVLVEVLEVGGKILGQKFAEVF